MFNKAKARRMRAQGYSYSRIGSFMGVSKQYVCDVLTNDSGDSRYNKIVYRGLADWMRRYNKTFGWMAKEMGMSAVTFSNKAQGKQQFTWAELQRLEVVTGRTVQMLMKEKEVST